MPEDAIFLSIPDLVIEEPLGGDDLSIEDEYVNIVLAADDTYFYPMLCVIKSACANKRPSTKYQFILLVDDSFTKDRERMVNSLLRQYQLPSAKIHNSGNEYLDVEYKADHLSCASCYRLQIPTLFPRMRKCIYLDCDILVRHDLSDFYDLLDADDLIVGVLAAAYQENPINAKSKAEQLGLPDIDTYTNSGALVMNLDRMREMGIQDVFDRMMGNGWPDIDQDILNAACYGRVQIAPPIYNAMTKYSFEEDAFEKDNAVSKCWTREEWEEARTDPTVVHFADTDKPWTDYALPFAKEWWEYIDEIGLTEEVFKFFYDLHAYRQRSVYEMRKKVNEATWNLRKATDAFNNERGELVSQLHDSRAKAKRLRERIASKNERIAVLREKLKAQRDKTISARKSLKATRAKLNAVKESKSYRLGKALTKPYRSIKGGKSNKAD